MKTPIAQVSLFILAFVALSLLMSYTRPASEEPKEYIVVRVQGDPEKFAKGVNEKLSEGWRVQGGVAIIPGNGMYMQALVK